MSMQNIAVVVVVVVVVQKHKKQLSLKSRGQSVRWPPGSAVPEDSVEDN